MELMKLLSISDGVEPAYVDMPIWYTHNIYQYRDKELLTMFWINEVYDPNDPILTMSKCDFFPADDADKTRDFRFVFKVIFS